LGTLGVIVEATFRLHPIPTTERTWVASFSTAAKAREAIGRILGSPLVPSAVELLNDTAAAEVARQPSPVSGLRGVLLAVAIASVPEAVEAQLQSAQTMARESSGALILEGAVHEAFWAAVRNFGPGEGAAMVLKASVLLTKVAEAIERGEHLAAQRGLRVAIISEAGTGILRYYFRGDDDADGLKRLAEVVDPLRAFAVEAKGSLVVLQAPPEVKAVVDVWGPAGKGFTLMRGLKEQFDPGHILNPGRFVGGL
jgi:glycolate oxidase FAD binding subunit